ncbi:MAG: hypothetical protein IT458_20250 [Planctomycetes bacterium]|nr:hypothetical protein [Planctomycetota bacterium]
MNLFELPNSFAVRLSRQTKGKVSFSVGNARIIRLDEIADIYDTSDAGYNEYVQQLTSDSSEVVLISAVVVAGELSFAFENRDANAVRAQLGEYKKELPQGEYTVDFDAESTTNHRASLVFRRTDEPTHWPVIAVSLWKKRPLPRDATALFSRSLREATALNTTGADSSAARQRSPAVSGSIVTHYGDRFASMDSGVSDKARIEVKRNHDIKIKLTGRATRRESVKLNGPPDKIDGIPTYHWNGYDIAIFGRSYGPSERSVLDQVHWGVRFIEQDGKTLSERLPVLASTGDNALMLRCKAPDDGYIILCGPNTPVITGFVGIDVYQIDYYRNGRIEIRPSPERDNARAHMARHGRSDLLLRTESYFGIQCEVEYDIFVNDEA